MWIGYAHVEIFMEFISRNKIQITFRPIYDFRCKKKRKKDQSWTDLWREKQ